MGRGGSGGPGRGQQQEACCASPRGGHGGRWGRGGTGGHSGDWRARPPVGSALTASSSPLCAPLGVSLPKFTWQEGQKRLPLIACVILLIALVASLIILCECDGRLWPSAGLGTAGGVDGLGPGARPLRSAGSGVQGAGAPCLRVVRG